MKQRGLYIFLALICALLFVSMTYGLVAATVWSTKEKQNSLYAILQFGGAFGVAISAFFLPPLLCVIFVRWILQRFSIVAFLINFLILVSCGYIFFINDYSIFFSKIGGLRSFLISLNALVLLLIGEFFIWKFHNRRSMPFSVTFYLKTLLICGWVVYQGIFWQEGFVMSQQFIMKEYGARVLLPLAPFVILLSLNTLTYLNLKDRERLLKSNLLIMSMGTIFFLSIVDLIGIQHYFLLEDLTSSVFIDLGEKLFFSIVGLVSMAYFLQLTIRLEEDKSSSYRAYFLSVWLSFSLISLILLSLYGKSISETWDLFMQNYASFMPYLMLISYISYFYQQKYIERIASDVLLGISYFACIKDMSNFAIMNDLSWAIFLVSSLVFSLLKECFIFYLNVRRSI